MRKPAVRPLRCLTCAIALLALWLAAPAGAQASCAAPANEIVAENCLAGTPPGIWDINGAGNGTIEGFATDISVDQGGSVAFKVSSPSGFTLEIYRLGWYGGLGARNVGQVTRAAPSPQPACATTPSTGLVDCGGWSVSASWSVPAGAVSGLYLAHAVRSDGGGEAHIPFVVRDDDGGSDLLFQTSDTTWQAYNRYGEYSLYQAPDGRAPTRSPTTGRSPRARTRPRTSCSTPSTR